MAYKVGSTFLIPSIPSLIAKGWTEENDFIHKNYLSAVHKSWCGSVKEITKVHMSMVCFTDSAVYLWVRESDLTDFVPSPTGILNGPPISSLLDRLSKEVKDRRDAMGKQKISCVPKCTCDIYALMRDGCRCGAFAAEQLAKKGHTNVQG